jgi:oligopeptide/dipeptide ABC transporter ATP-binding protein
MDAVPVAHPARRREREPISGESPSAVNPPPGCAFHPRCPFAVEVCREQVPELEPTGSDGNHVVACHRKGEV